MNPHPGANSYLRTKILTASPHELRLMLYDGALRFCRLAQQAFDQQKKEDAFNALMRAQKIVLELSTSLNHETAPEICERLTALYTYIYRLLVDATVEHSVEPLKQALGLLEYERETWQLAMAKLAGQASPDNVSGAQQTAINTLSVDG